MTAIATRLAEWACALEPDGDDLALARRSLLDTLAVTLAGRSHPVAGLTRGTLCEAGRWAAVGHVLDFDNLRMPSTTHVSVVCVPVTLAARGDARAYLAGAGVMARLGTVLGWSHYASGWHATCTAGAPAAAVAAATAMGLDAEATARAIALAVPGAGGVQRAFGTDAKSLQVGFAVETGLRAARLAAAGAGCDLRAVEAWLDLVAAGAAELDLAGPAVPDGLAVKIYPACYALQRPIAALAGSGVAHDDVTRIVLRTPQASLAPLVHHVPTTGLEGKFSLEYAAAAALLDPHQGFDSFTDAAVARASARRLVDLVEVVAEPGGEGLLDGEFRAEVHIRGGVVRVALRCPPGAPHRPPTDGQLATKIADCLQLAGLSGLDARSWTWDGAAQVLREHV